MKVFRKIGSICRKGYEAVKSCGRAVKAFVVGAVVAGATAAANAQTDISQVTTTVSNYKDAAITVAVAILLFVIGRAVLRKLIK